MQFITRHLEEGDKSFIYNSFLESYHKNYPIKLVPKTIYYKNQAKIIDFLLDNSQVLLACFPEDADELLGYIIYEYISEALVIHYVYTKNSFRSQYIAKQLIEQILDGKELIITTHITDNFKDLKFKVPGVKMVHDPYLLTNLRLQKK